MSNKDGLVNTIITAVVLCLVCSTIVSITSIGLRERQAQNKALDKKKNVLMAAGLLDAAGAQKISEIFSERIETRIIDLATGEDVTSEYENPDEFDPEPLMMEREHRIDLSNDRDLAQIRQREVRAPMYVIKTSESDRTPAGYVFPVRGKGLWSTLRGFLAIDAELKNSIGITFYQHAETPGLGGEIEADYFRDAWKGANIFDDKGNVVLKITKARVEENKNEIDSLSGATITSVGVERLVRFWMGADGFGPKLQNLRDSK